MVQSDKDGGYVICRRQDIAAAVESNLDDNSHTYDVKSVTDAFASEVIASITSRFWNVWRVWSLVQNIYTLIPTSVSLKGY